MKVKTTRIDDKPVFVPRKIEITFDTEDELVAFYMIFNHTHIQNAPGVKGVLDYSKIGESLCSVASVEYRDKWQDFRTHINGS